MTAADGTYAIRDVPEGTYRKVYASGAGFEPRIRTLDVGSGTGDWQLRRDWAASSGGAEIADFSGADYSDFGCGPAGMIDMSATVWGSEAKGGSNGTGQDVRYVRLTMLGNQAADNGVDCPKDSAPPGRARSDWQICSTGTAPSPGVFLPGGGTDLPIAPLATCGLILEGQGADEGSRPAALAEPAWLGYGRNVDEEPGSDPQAPGEDAADDRLIGLAKDWAASIVANDPVRIAGFMTDEWVIVSESGVTSKEQFLSLVESGELTHSAMDLVTQPRVRVYNDAAVLTARVTNTAHYQGARYDADEWTTDVFVKRDGRWLCVLSHITPVTQSSHGSPTA